MKVIEPGHIYELDQLDTTAATPPQVLTFVNREAGTAHAGTQTQEVLRATIDALGCLVDRTNHCDACLRWEGNDKIIKALTEAQRQLRRALLLHEQRAQERKLEKGWEPEKVATSADGHFPLPVGNDNVAIRRDTMTPSSHSSWRPTPQWACAYCDFVGRDKDDLIEHLQAAGPHMQ